MVGQTVSNYKILEKLGQGGMGSVYKAQDVRLDRFAVLKFLLPHISQDEGAKERFVQEAKAASALNHHNIVTIHTSVPLATATSWSWSSSTDRRWTR